MNRLPVIALTVISARIFARNMNVHRISAKYQVSVISSLALDNLGIFSAGCGMNRLYKNYLALKWPPIKLINDNAGVTRTEHISHMYFLS